MSLLVSIALLMGNIPAVAFATDELATVEETVAPAATEPPVVETEAPTQPPVPEETSAPTEAATEPPVPETEVPTQPPVPEETSAPTEAPTEPSVPETEAPTQPLVPEETTAPTEPFVPEETVTPTEGVKSEEGTVADEAALAGDVLTDAETGFTYVIETGESEEQTVTITGYTGTETVLVIPETIADLPVTKLADRAFSGRNEITGVTVTGNLETLGSQTFSSINNLEEVILSGEIADLGYHTFSNCYKLKRVEIGEKVKGLGTGTFTNCKLLEEITLPQEITSLGNDIFFGCYALKAIELPAGLTSIGESAFAASGISSIEFPQTLTDLGASAFSNCDGLTSVVIPTGVTELKTNTFHYCDNLSSITLPDTMTVLGNGSLAGTALTALELPKDLTTIGGYAFENTDLTELTIPEGVTAIGERAFLASSKLQKVTLPKNLTSLGDHAFDDCTALTDITLPEGLTYLGSYAFSGCSALKSITIPASVGTLNSNTFSYCSSLENVTISEGITGLGRQTFSYCGGLKSIVIPDSITDMGSSVFLRCTSLEAVTLPKDLTSLGRSTFDGCTSLTGIDLPESLTSLGESVFSGSGLTAIELPQTVTDLDKSAFYGTSLISIEIPAGITELKENVFRNCGNLSSVTLPDTLTTLGNGVFAGCTALTQLKLPGSLTTVGEYAFQSAGLTEISVPAGVTAIGEGAFSLNASLQKVTLPDTLTALGEEAFRGSTALTEITLPAGITTVPYRCFSGCTGLETINLPETVKVIGTYAFEDCGSMTRIELPAGVETIDTYVFEDCGKLETVLLPETLKTINYYAFNRCTSLKSITLPAGLTALGNGVFQHCSALESIVIPAGITELKDYLFLGCAALKQVTLPADLTTIGGLVLAECTSLESIEIPSSVTKLGNAVFRDSTALKHVKIGFGVESIGSECFKNCSPELTLEVWEGSYAENYAIENNINYTLAGNGATVVVKLDPEVYKGMQLVLTSGTVRRAARVQEQSEYRFTGVKDGSDAQLQVINAYGDILETHNLTKVYEEVTLNLAGATSIGSIALTLLDENGNDISAQLSVEWYNEEKVPYASGFAVPGVPVGKVLRAAIRLPESYAKQYHAPESILHTVTAGENVLQMQLKRIPIVEIMGSVTNGTSPLNAASVTVTQTINGKYTEQTTAVTNKQGEFLLEIPALDAEVTISAPGYEDRTLTLTALSEGADLGAVALEPITGTVVTVEAELLSRARAGEDAQSRKLTSLSNMAFTVYNKTQSAQVESVLVQGMTLVLKDHSAPGDELEITVTSLNKAFQPLTGTVTVGENDRAAWTAALKEPGSIAAEYVSTKNTHVQLLVYNEAGKRMTSVSAAASQALPETAALEDGNYTVVLMSKPSLIEVPAVLGDFAALELEAERDYVSCTAAVRAGEITLCRFATVPVLNESRFCYTDPDATSFAASKSALTAGQYFTLRASAAFAQEYREQISDVKWIFQLPEGLEYYDGTLTVEGNSDISYEIIDGNLVIPTQDPSEIVRFCVYATQEGEISSTAYLEFTYEGRTIRQSIGSAAVKVGLLDFEVTGKTFRPEIMVFGTSGSNALIQLYDNGVLVGVAHSDTNGKWKQQIVLQNTDTYTCHDIQAVMKLPSGTLVYGETHTVIYQYSPNPITLVGMSMSAGQDMGGNMDGKMVFDSPPVRWENGKPIYPNTKSTYVTVGNRVYCTFVVKFECEDISRLSDVTIEVYLNNGGRCSLPMELDEDYIPKSGESENTYQFVAGASFEAGGNVWEHSDTGMIMHKSDLLSRGFPGLPKNMAVSYVYDQELVFSGTHISDLKWEAAEAAEISTDINEFREQNGGRVFPLLPMDEDFTNNMPADIYQLCKEYNANVTEFNDLEDELKILVDRIYGNIQVTQTSLSISSEYMAVDVDTRELPSFSVAEKISEGYSVFQVGEDKNNLILMKLGKNAVNGRFEQNIIDTTGLAATGFGGAAMFVLNGAQLAELVEEDVQKSGVEYHGRFSITEAGAASLEADIEHLYSCQIQMESTMQVIGSNMQQLLDRVSAETADAAQPQTRAGLNWDVGNTIVSILSPYAAKGFRWLGDATGFIGDLMGIHQIWKYHDIWAKTGSESAQHAYLMRGFGMLTSVMLFGVALAGCTVSLPATIGVALLCLAWGSLLDATLKPYEDEADADYKTWEAWEEKIKNYERFPGGEFEAKIDPSGYIYEAVPSNRLEGVTVTSYEKVTKYDIYDEPYEEIVFWDASEYEQANPLLTDALGRYAWDVPEGWWQVKAEKEGYKTAYSEWLPVPPPQLDVNLGLVSYAVPEISDVFARTDSVEVEFSKYMRAETLTAENVTVSVNGQRISGSMELLNAEESPAEAGKMLASKLRFTPGESLAEGAVVTVAVTDAALSYADVAAKNGSKDATVVRIPDSLFAPESVQLLYKNTATVTIQAVPAELASGETVQLSVMNDEYLSVEEETVTLDENGCAVIHIRGKLPGNTALQLSMCDGRVQTMVWVMIRMPGSEGSLESLSLDQDYLAMTRGESAQLTAEVQPAGLADTVCWSVEEGGETVVAVDATGKVTALKPGLAYVLASVTTGDTTITTRCRIDVAEPELNEAEKPVIEVKGVQLSRDKVTTELFSTNYATFEILLQLPQNEPAANGKMTISRPAAMSLAGENSKKSAAIDSVEFTTKELNDLFELKMLDDRTVQLIPRYETAIESALENSKSVKGTYKDTIKVTVQGTDYYSELLTLTVKQTKPKLTGTVPAFNSFYTGQTQQITIKGATPKPDGFSPNEAKATAKTPEIPTWLKLQEDTLTLKPDAPLKSVSGSAHLLVQTEQWRIPAAVTLRVKNTYKAPGVKLSATSVSISAQTSAGAALKLLCTNKKDTLTGLNVDHIEATNGFVVEEGSFNIADGSFILHAPEGFTAQTITLKVHFSGTDNTLDLKLKVTPKAVTLKLSPTSVTLNREARDSIRVKLTATPADHQIDPVFTLTTTQTVNGKKVTVNKWESGELDVDYENGQLLIGTTAQTPEKATYKLGVSSGGSKPVTLTINVMSGAASVTYKATGSMDLSFPAQAAVIKPTFKNYKGEIVSYDYAVTELKGKTVVNEDVKDAFYVEYDGKAFSIRCREESAAQINTANTYRVRLNVTLNSGETIGNTINLKVKRTAVKLKLSATKLTLNKQTGDSGSIAVTCTTKGYAFTEPLREVTDKYKQAAADQLDIRWENGRLIVKTVPETVYGMTYTVTLRGDAYGTAVKLTVSIPTEEKSTVTATLKAKNAIDVVRDGTAITLTPTYKNILDRTGMDETLVFTKTANKVTSDATDLFDCERNENGTFTVTKKAGAKLDHSAKYKVKLVTTKDGKPLCETKAISISVKAGSVKLTAKTDNTTLFAKDKNDRALVWFEATDARLNGVKDITIANTTQARQFEIIPYGDDLFAIGFKDGEVDSALTKKNINSVSIKLNVFVDGNETTKASTTATVKLTIVK